jgi:S-adenosylmethionine decarboxylase
MRAAPPIAFDQGVEWIVDAHDCDPARLRSQAAVESLFARLVRELGLKPIGPPRFHVFPEPGGITGLVLLTESHLTCHTYPELGFCALNLYCCSPRPEWPWADGLREHLGAGRVELRTLRRPMSGPGRSRG